MLEINLLDIATAIVLLVLLTRGLVRGLTREVTGLVGVIGGFALARHFQYKVQPVLEPLFNDQKIAAIVAFALILVAAMILAAILGAALRKFMSITLTSWIDHLLGGMAGLAKGIFIVTLAFFLLQRFFPGLAIVKNAQATPLFNSLINYLRDFLPVALTYTFPSFNL